MQFFLLKNAISAQLIDNYCQSKDVYTVSLHKIRKILQTQWVLNAISEERSQGSDDSIERVMVEFSAAVLNEMEEVLNIVVGELHFL